MALTDDNGGGMIMPVQPMGGNYGGYGVPYAVPVANGYGYGGGFGNGFGGDWSGLIVLFLFAALFGGGFGGFGGFGGWGMMNGMWGMDGAFPWLLASNANNQNATNAGFDNLAATNAIGNLSNAVTNGFSDTQLGIAGVNQNICQSTGQLSNALCQGFAGTTAAVTNAQNAVTQQLYNNEINSLNRSFAEQTANTAAVSGLSNQLSDCCCENRLATANLSALVQSENCADREALSNGIRDIISNQTAGVQRILDTLCQDKIDAKNEKIQELQTQVAMQNLAASQAAQTAALVADNTAQTQYIVNRVAPYPIPAYPVNNPYGCGYGFGYNNGFNSFNGFNPFGNVGFGNGSF